MPTEGTEAAPQPAPKPENQQVQKENGSGGDQPKIESKAEPSPEAVADAAKLEEALKTEDPGPANALAEFANESSGDGKTDAKNTPATEPAAPGQTTDTQDPPAWAKSVTGQEDDTWKKFDTETTAHPDAPVEASKQDLSTPDEKATASADTDRSTDKTSYPNRAKAALGRMAQPFKRAAGAVRNFRKPNEENPGEKPTAETSAPTPGNNDTEKIVGPWDKKVAGEPLVENAASPAVPEQKTYTAAEIQAAKNQVAASEYAKLPVSDEVAKVAAAEAPEPKPAEAANADAEKPLVSENATPATETTSPTAEAKMSQEELKQRKQELTDSYKRGEIDEDTLYKRVAALEKNTDQNGTDTNAPPTEKATEPKPAEAADTDQPLTTEDFKNETDKNAAPEEPSADALEQGETPKTPEVLAEEKRLKDLVRMGAKLNELGVDLTTPDGEKLLALAIQPQNAEEMNTQLAEIQTNGKVDLAAANNLVQKKTAELNAAKAAGDTDKASKLSILLRILGALIAAIPLAVVGASAGTIVAAEQGLKRA